MYKLSVGHVKIFCNFFASTTGFQQNSAEFSAKSAGNRLLNFQKIQLIIRLIQLNFIFLNFFCSFRTSATIQPNFHQILQNTTNWPEHEFSFPAEDPVLSLRGVVGDWWSCISNGQEKTVGPPNKKHFAWAVDPPGNSGSPLKEHTTPCFSVSIRWISSSLVRIPLVHVSSKFSPTAFME
jgi:hypothetical protein